MRKITLDHDLRAKLGDLSGEVALCDADGNIVAFIMPPGHRDMMYRMAANLFDDEELEAARREYAEHGGKTTAEVLAHLAELERELTRKGA